MIERLNRDELQAAVLDESDRFLTLGEAESLTGYSTHTIRRWILAGDLPGYQASRHCAYRILASQLTALIDQGAA